MVHSNHDACPEEIRQAGLQRRHPVTDIVFLHENRECRDRYVAEPC